MRTQTAPALAETTAQDTRSSNGMGRMTDKYKTAVGRWGERLRRAALATFAVLMGVLPLTPGTACQRRLNIDPPRRFKTDPPWSVQGAALAAVFASISPARRLSLSR